MIMHLMDIENNKWLEKEVLIELMPIKIVLFRDNCRIWVCSMFIILKSDAWTMKNAEN